MELYEEWLNNTEYFNAVDTAVDTAPQLILTTSRMKYVIRHMSSPNVFKEKHQWIFIVSVLLSIVGMDRLGINMTAAVKTHSSPQFTTFPLNASSSLQNHNQTNVCCSKGTICFYCLRT